LSGIDPENTTRARHPVDFSSFFSFRHRQQQPVDSLLRLLLLDRLISLIVFPFSLSLVSAFL